MIDMKKAPKKSKDGMLAGVASGIAKNFDVDPFWVRLATVLLLPVSFGFVIFVYIALAIIMESESK